MRHRLAERTPRLDLADLRRASVLAGNQGLVPVWLDRQVAAHIAATVTGGHDTERQVVLRFTLRERTLSDVPTGGALTLVRTPCRFGGWRYWLYCPGLPGRAPCGRRGRVFYLADDGRGFRCRLCANVAYLGQQRHREAHFEGFTRPFRALAKIEERLTRTRSRNAGAKFEARAEQLDAQLDSYLSAEAKVRQRRLRGLRATLRREDPSNNAREPSRVSGTGKQRRRSA